jgi:cytochrome c556
MGMIGNGKVWGVAVCVLALLSPVAASSQDAGEKATYARQGFMNLVSWEAGSLFAMAKGDTPYDAEVAKSHADRIATLYEYPFPSLFLPGTSKEDRPGKTRALPEIWTDEAGFNQKFNEEKALVATLAEQAGNGQEALAAAVGEIGKGCGGCHKAFRAKDY